MQYKKSYSVTYKPNTSNLYYSITGVKESFEFYSKQWENVRLMNSNSNDFITVSSQSLLETKLKLNFCYENIFKKLKFFEKTTKKNGYKINAELLTGQQLDWTWKPCKNSDNWVLVDKRDGDKVLAEIEGFTLTMKNKGGLSIANDIAEGFEGVILVGACLVFKLEMEKKRLMSYKENAGVGMLGIC